MSHEILIVDDEPDIRTLVAGILRDEGFETRDAGDSGSAIAAFKARRPALVVLDVWLQGSALDGLALLKMFHGEEPQVPVVMKPAFLQAICWICTCAIVVKKDGKPHW